MNDPVEAQSLSSLTSLFANPPQYPRNPTHEVHQSLVLYIVRVPGSQDVFLTPLKPPTKASISLEAIQSSLYYLHVPVPEDEGVRQSIEQQRPETETRQTISRKPLPNIPHANYPPSERPQLPPKYYPHHQPGLNGPEDTQAERYAARGSHLRLNTSPVRHIHRKQLGALNKHTRLDSSASSQSDGEHSWGVDERPYPQFIAPEQRLSSDSNRSSPLAIQENGGYFSQKSISPARPGLPTLTPTVPADKPITLIRRDPTSSSQWNVGTITRLHPTFEGSAVHPISIELTTPGYGRFTGQKEVVRPGSANSDAASIKRDIETSLPSPNPHFTRTVDFRVLDESLVGGHPGLRRHRTNSIDIFRPNSPLKSDHHKEAEKPKNVLSFPSIWSGAVCTFSNGLDGRTLRLKHTVPSLSSNGTENMNSTRNVAELRFNLPWSILKSKETRKQARDAEEPDKLPISQLLESKKKDWRRSFQHLKHKSFEKRRENSSPTRHDRMENPSFSQAHYHESQYDDDSVLRDMTNMNLQPPRKHNFEDDERDRISLRLGREKAGGGYKGKSAKLGKLIIEDEGLKMADLVVAACMGVWWQHYQEKPIDDFGY